MKIGIIGYGYVGSAVAASYSDTLHDLIIRDPKIEDSASLDEFVNCDAIFVCVPSPSLESGHCDTSILEQTLKELLFVLINKPIPIICKTTAPPSVYERLQKQYPNIVHCPEFLTARDNIRDYLNSKFFVVGGERVWAQKAVDVIHLGVMLVHDKLMITDIKTAAMYKYMMNSYLATKVTFMNDFAKLAEAEGVEWSKLTGLALWDDRIGHTHMEVPGPDGKFGWGGGCFPKDIAAIIEEGHDLGVTMELLGRVEDLNKKHRKE